MQMDITRRTSTAILEGSSYIYSHKIYSPIVWWSSWIS